MTKSVFAIPALATALSLFSANVFAICVGYDGPGGPCYAGPGGPIYAGPGGNGGILPNCH